MGNVALTVPGVKHICDEIVYEGDLRFGHAAGVSVEHGHHHGQPLSLLLIRLRAKTKTNSVASKQNNESFDGEQTGCLPRPPPGRSTPLRSGPPTRCRAPEACRGSPHLHTWLASALSAGGSLESFWCCSGPRSRCSCSAGSITQERATSSTETSVTQISWLSMLT